MANIEPIASVIDLEKILQPVSEENPSGESLQYSGLYDEIREARRASDGLPQGQWQEELKIADYSQVIYLAVPALETQTKDLQIAAWLSESLIREHGFAGLRDSFKLLSGLQETFWETIFPEIDDGIGATFHIAFINFGVDRFPKILLQTGNQFHTVAQTDKGVFSNQRFRKPRGNL